MDYLRLASLKLLLLFSVLAWAVNSSHEKQSVADCPNSCICGTTSTLRSVLSGQDFRENSAINCTGRNLTHVPDLLEESYAEALLLENNYITRADLAFLKSFTKLKFLSLRRNLLRAISKSTDDYQPFFNLLYMDLSDNTMHVIHPYVFSGFPSLKMLNLSGNVLHTISANAFSLPSLQTLDLARNQLGVIHPNYFATSPRLSEIDISHNGVSRLNEGTFGMLTRLSVLDLSHNSLLIIESNVLVGMNVTNLDLGYNSLRRPPTLPLRKLEFTKTLILDGNPFEVLEEGDISNIRAEFISMSHCNHLLRMEKNAIENLPELKTLTINGNKRLAYIDPHFIKNTPWLEALDLSRNSLYAIEKDILRSLTMLKALYLGGNPFNCHCGLSWIGASIDASTFEGHEKDISMLQNQHEQEAISEMAIKVVDMKHIYCTMDSATSSNTRRVSNERSEGEKTKVNSNNNNNNNNIVQLSDISHKFTDECEPYIIPLFESSNVEEMMGKNISWLCKALGSDDIDLLWRLPRRMPSHYQYKKENDNILDDAKDDGTNGHEIVVANGQCIDRVCVKDGMLTIRYLHPTADSGKYICEAKSKYGKDQRQVRLTVKSQQIQIFPITVASRFVTISWNTSSSLSTHRGYVLRVKRSNPLGNQLSDNDIHDKGTDSRLNEGRVRQYEDIDVGLKMNSYTVNGLTPGATYLFELCLRKENYVINISSATLTTKNSGFEVEAGIETDWITILSVALILVGLTATCIAISIIRWWRYHTYLVRVRAKSKLAKSGVSNNDTSSQREMITSPSDHSSVAVNANTTSCLPQPTFLQNKGKMTTSKSVNSTNEKVSNNTISQKEEGTDVFGEDAFEGIGSTIGDESHLVEHEIASPTEDVHLRESLVSSTHC